MSLKNKVNPSCNKSTIRSLIRTVIKLFIPKIKRNLRIWHFISSQQCHRFVKTDLATEPKGMKKKWRIRGVKGHYRYSVWWKMSAGSTTLQSKLFWPFQSNLVYIWFIVAPENVTDLQNWSLFLPFLLFSSKQSRKYNFFAQCGASRLLIILVRNGSWLFIPQRLKRSPYFQSLIC